MKKLLLFLLFFLLSAFMLLKQTDQEKLLDGGYFSLNVKYNDWEKNFMWHRTSKDYVQFSIDKEITTVFTIVEKTDNSVTLRDNFETMYFEFMQGELMFALVIVHEQPALGVEYQEVVIYKHKQVTYEGSKKVKGI